MIHSRVVTDSGNGGQNRSKDIWLLLGGLLVVGFLVGLVRSTELLVIDLGLWRPILLGTGLLFAGLWLKFYLKRPLDQIWDLIKANIPATLIGALVFGVIGIGPQGSGSLPLTISNLPVYLVTFGFWPLLAGPEALLRGFALGLALSVVWREYRDTRQDLKSALAGLGVWLACTLALFIPSIVISTAVMANGYSILGVSGMSLAENFSRLNLNTYWSNLQLTRWFTGFGGELPNMMALFTLSWTMVIGLIVFLASRCRPKEILGDIRRWVDQPFEFWFLATAVPVGLLAGWGRMPYSPLDLAAWLILMVVVYLVLTVSVRDWRAWRSPILIVTAGLLGWPVLLPIICLLCVVWIRENSRTSTKPWAREVFLLVIWFLLSGACLAFMRGAKGIETDMIWVVLTFAILSIPALIARYCKEKPSVWSVVAITWLIASLIAAGMARSFAVCALALLAVAIGHIVLKSRSALGRYLPQFIILTLLIILVVAFWLPRWINPRLLPL